MMFYGDSDGLFFYGDYDGFDVNDDPIDPLDEYDRESSFDDDDNDDSWDFVDQDDDDSLAVDAVAATLIFPIGENDNIEEIEKKANSWVEFSEEIFAKEDLVNANDADIFTYSIAEAEQNYFCYWQ